VPRTAGPSLDPRDDERGCQHGEAPGQGAQGRLGRVEKDLLVGPALAPLPQVKCDVDPVGLKRTLLLRLRCALDTA
jgi:hypothetical protein